MWTPPTPPPPKIPPFFLGKMNFRYGWGTPLAEKISTWLQWYLSYNGSRVMGLIMIRCWRWNNNKSFFAASSQPFITLNVWLQFTLSYNAQIPIDLDQSYQSINQSQITVHNCDLYFSNKQKSSQLKKMIFNQFQVSTLACHRLCILDNTKKGKRVCSMWSF